MRWTLRKRKAGARSQTASRSGGAEKAGYQILLTWDPYQQNLTLRQMPMIVLGSNIWPGIRPRIAEITAALERVSPGSFEFVEIAPPARRRRLPRPQH
jgi:hypothetical protein